MRFSLIIILALLFCSNSLLAQDNTQSRETTELPTEIDKLNILWTTSDKETIKNMMAMYSIASIKNGWWKEINIIVWGGSAKLIKEDKEIQQLVQKMVGNGIHIEACHACASRYDAVELLKSLGIEVKYMGNPLTKYIKNGEKILTL